MKGQKANKMINLQLFSIKRVVWIYSSLSYSPMCRTTHSPKQNLGKIQYLFRLVVMKIIEVFSLLVWRLYIGLEEMRTLCESKSCAW